MLNESKVKLMTRMAMYESKQGEEDFKISSYIRKITGAFTPLLRSYGSRSAMLLQWESELLLFWMN